MPVKGRSDCNGKLGVVGFCCGGDVAHALSTQLPELNAAMSFYGNHPPGQDAAKVKAPLLIHFADIDERSTPPAPNWHGTGPGILREDLRG